MESIHSFYIEGVQIRFRPIMADDEQLWLDFLNECSSESIYSRFHYFFNYKSFEVAHRYCCLNTQKEIAIVAEIEESERKKIIGIGRLISDASHENAEFAIIVSDFWQKKHIGGHLIDYCIDVAIKWNIKKIMAYTNTDNVKMVSMLRHRGFDIKIEKSTSDVMAEKELQ